MPTVITPQGPLGRLADALMTPIMYLLSGTFYEAPQRTHVWNNQKLSPEQVTSWLIRNLAVSVGSNPRASKPKVLGILPYLHMPILGGWRDYVVLECLLSEEDYPWHVGWFVDGGVAGVSLVPLRGRFVRLLVGPAPTTFFALMPDGEQVKLVQAGEGVIGHHGQFRDVPLL